MADPIILASGSAIRRQLLVNAHVPFEVVVARIDEEAVKASLVVDQAKPRDIADVLAEMKALRVSSKHPDAWVIGSDQVADFDGGLLSKPISIAQAREQLCLLRGQMHKLFSASVIARDGQIQWRHVGQARLWMRDFSDEWLDQYLSRMGDDAMATVGAYKLEEEGVRLFSRIEGDYFSVLGMPLLEILNHLTTIGALPK
jgi:septum formation protein